VKNFQSCRLVVAGFAILACTAAQSPCGGSPRDLVAAATARQNGLGIASVIPFTGVAPSVTGDATLAYAEWRQGVGCPNNVVDPAYTCFASSDPADALNVGLFLVKTGPTTSDLAVDLSMYPGGVGDLPPYASADLQGVAGSKVSDLFELGYEPDRTC